MFFKKNHVKTISRAKAAPACLTRISLPDGPSAGDNGYESRLNVMQNSTWVARVGASIRNLAVAGGLALTGALASGQAPAGAASSAQPAAAASLSDSLLAKATALYDSTTKSGLRGFDCQVHPDWKEIIASSRGGAPVSGDDPRLALVSTAKITLHARMAGGSTLDWQASAGEPLSPSKQAEGQALLERAHHGIENTLLGVLKLWIPLVDGSVAESLGEEGATIAATDTGYTVRSGDKLLTENFDGGLLLKRYLTTDAGATVDIAPTYEQEQHGLQLTAFSAQVSPGGGAGGQAQQMDVAVTYQSVSGMQIPSAVNIDVANIVTMNFKLDGCAANPAR